VEPRIEAIPICLLPEYGNYITEQYLPNTKVLEIDLEIGDWIDIRKNKAKTKFPQCESCSHFLCCEGTWKEYPEIFGHKEFIPVKPIPNEIIIELTKKCNLNCDFCYNTKTKGKEVTTSQIFKIIDSIKGKTNAIRFTGGEPLLREDLNELLECAKKNKLYTILNTNGELFNEENINLIDNVDDLLISFHDISKKNQISALFKLIKKQKNSIFLRVCTTLTKKNIESLEEFYSFMQYQPVNDWFLLRQIPNKKNPEPISKKEAKEMIDKIISLNKKFQRNTKIANSLPFCVTEMGKTASICIGGKNDSGHTRIMIDSAGKILADYNIEKIFGDVEKEDITKIWLSSVFTDIRNLNYLPDKCLNCIYKVVCKGGLYNDYLR
jgi:radical SAM protein with 4Fe4S-binding SPASM domain